MSVYKKTLHITDITKTPYGAKLVYSFTRLDTSVNLNTAPYQRVQQPLFKNKKYTPKSGDKIYFFPGCEVPNFKLKEYLNTHNVSRVKFKVRANVAIVGPESYSDLFIHLKRSLVNYDTFFNWLNHIFPIGDARTIQLRHDLKVVNENFEWIIIDDKVLDQMLDNNTPFNIKINIKEEHEQHATVYNHLYAVKDEQAYETLQEMLKPGSIFFNQDEILADLNTGMVIDEDVYNNLCNLFDSSDVENTKIAMEFISNCDYKASAYNIMMLMKKYGNKMYSTKNKDHVNFKALLSYFNVKTLSQVSLDQIIDSLAGKNLLTQELLDRLLPEIKADILSKIKYKHFSVEDIVFSDTIKESLAFNSIQKELKPVPEVMTAGELSQAVKVIGPTVVVERSESGQPLMSMTPVIMDLSKPEDPPTETGIAEFNYDL